MRALLKPPISDWAVPYLFLALSDYVVQVANTVAHETALHKQLAEFAHRNRELHKLALARTLSYWDLNRHEGIVDVGYSDFPPFRVLASLDKK